MSAEQELKQQEELKKLEEEKALEANLLKEKEKQDAALAAKNTEIESKDKEVEEKEDVIAKLEEEKAHLSKSLEEKSAILKKAEYDDITSKLNDKYMDYMKNPDNQHIKDKFKNFDQALSVAKTIGSDATSIYEVVKYLSRHFQQDAVKLEDKEAAPEKTETKDVDFSKAKPKFDPNAGPLSNDEFQEKMDAFEKSFS